MRLKLLLACAGALSVAFAMQARGEDAPAPAPPAMKLMLELSDGSRILGEPSIAALKMSTSYADLEIPLAKFRSIEFGGDKEHDARASLLNGDVINGSLAATEISMKTIFGEVKIPVAVVRRMRMVASAGGSMPEGLVLHYTFNKEQGEKIADMSGSGNDGAVHGATYADDARAGGAMSYNGDSQAVVIKNQASLQLQDFSIVA